MTCNYRSTCPYCKNCVLNRDFGSHILRTHEDLLFTKDNLKALHRDKYLKKPLEVSFDTEVYYYCLADRSCIKKFPLAEKHFKGKTEAHKEAILKLREKYPLNAPEETLSESLLTDRDSKIIQQELCDLIVRLRELEQKAAIDEADSFCFTKKGLLAFSKINIKVDDDSLKELFPSAFPEPVGETEATPFVEEEDELLPLVVEKPMTIKEVIQQNLTEKIIEDNSKSVVTGEVKTIPELEMFKNIIGNKPLQKNVPEKSQLPQPTLQPVQPTIPIHAKRKPKATDDQVSVRPSVPIPTPPIQSLPEEKKDLQKEAEKLIAEMDQFKNKSPWQRFVQTNHNLSVQEQVQLAASMGIRPDAQNSRIVSNTKAAKPLRQN